jgi:hypothetical protein
MAYLLKLHMWMSINEVGLVFAEQSSMIVKDVIIFLFLIIFNDSERCKIFFFANYNLLDGSGRCTTPLCYKL